MHVAPILIAVLAIGSAGGAALASDLAASSLRPDAAAHGCDILCPSGHQHGNQTSGNATAGNGTSDPHANQTQEPERHNHTVRANQTRQAVREAAADADCAPSRLFDNGTYFRTFISRDDARDEWQFDVPCASSRIDIRLELSGSGPADAWLDFDNRISLFDGADELADSSHTALEVDALTGRSHMLYSFQSEGDVAPGTWTLSLQECLLMGEYELRILVH